MQLNSKRELRKTRDGTRLNCFYTIMNMDCVRDDETSTVTFVIPSGSLNDPYRKRGLAHLIEHLLCRHLNRCDEFRDIIEKHHLKFRAATSYDYILFELDGGVISKAQIQWLRKKITGYDLERKDFYHEKIVVEKEIRWRKVKSPNGQLANYIRKVTGNYYPSTHLGSVKSLSNIDHEYCTKMIRAYVSKMLIFFNARLIGGTISCARNRQLELPSSHTVLDLDHRHGEGIFGWKIKNCGTNNYLYILIWWTLINNEYFSDNSIFKSHPSKKIFFRTVHCIIMGYAIFDIRTSRELDTWLSSYEERIQFYLSQIEYDSDFWKYIKEQLLLKLSMQHQNRESLVYETIWVQLSKFNEFPNIYSSIRNLNSKAFLGWLEKSRLYKCPQRKELIE